MKDYLPIGSVVLLKNATKRLMICGRVQTHVEQDKTYDYSGCLYPEGYMGAQDMYLFNNEDIDKVYYMGMQDEEEFKFRRYILNKVKEQESGEK